MDVMNLHTFTSPVLQVWQFLLKDISFRLNPTGQGSARKAPEIKADVIKLVCVEYKLATEHMEKK